MPDNLPSDDFMYALLRHTFGTTEANEHTPSTSQAFAAWQEQIAKGETMGVIQMYEDAYTEAIARERQAKHA